MQAKIEKFSYKIVYVSIINFCHSLPVDNFAIIVCSKDETKLRTNVQYHVRNLLTILASHPDV